MTEEEEKQPETLNDIWADDLLDRRADAEYLETFLLNRISERSEAGKKKSYVLNIDAQWGDGKSFFIDRLAKQLGLKHLVAKVNAWETDFANDPLLAVMDKVVSALEEQLPHTHDVIKNEGRVKKLASIAGKVALTVGKGLLWQGAKKLVGEAAEEAWAQVNDEKGADNNADFKLDTSKLMDAAAGVANQDFQQSKQTVDEFKDYLTELLKDINNIVSFTLFIVVDELDRCRPTYAIEMLERIKHLFDIDNIVFVLATDVEQLSHSICAVYGSGFDGRHYLNRFFDQTYRFELVNTDRYVQVLAAQEFDHTTKFSGEPLIDNEFQTVPVSRQIADFCGLFSLSLRQSMTIVETLRNIHSSLPLEAKMPIATLLPFVAAPILAIEIPLSGQLPDDYEAKRLKRRPGTSYVLQTKKHTRDGHVSRSGRQWHEIHQTLIQVAVQDHNTLYQWITETDGARRFFANSILEKRQNADPHIRALAETKNVVNLVKTAGRLSSEGS